MQGQITPARLLKLLAKAEESYSVIRGTGVAQRMRLRAIRGFVEEQKKNAPQKPMTISLEDWVLLTDLP